MLLVDTIERVLAVLTTISKIVIFHMGHCTCTYKLSDVCCVLGCDRCVLHRESRLGSTARLIEGLEQELESPGSRPLSSTSCETEQMTSTAKDDVQS